MPAAPPPNSWKWRCWRAYVRGQVLLYRVSGGRLAGRRHGMPVLLLEHVGRRTGKRRTTPLMYLHAEDGDGVVVVASKGGADTNPAWFYNLRAKPDATVRVGRARLPVSMRVATGEERRELWAKLVHRHTRYASYQAQTSREIPVLILDRRR